MAPTRILHRDKGYDRYLYRDRNAIERMFCRRKDFRRVATRYDRIARTSWPPCASLLPSLTGYEFGP